MPLLLAPSPETSQFTEWLSRTWHDSLVCLKSFVFLLTHDTEGGPTRQLLIPYILGGWLVASVASCPLAKLLLRGLGANPDMRRVFGINFGILLTQLAFFGVNWYVIGWGNRSADWGVFGASLVPALLIAHLGFELPIARALLYAVLQPLLALLLVFVAVFVLVQTGHLQL